MPQLQRNDKTSIYFHSLIHISSASVFCNIEKNAHNSDHMVSKVITSFWVKKRVGQLGVKDEKSLVERKSS